MKATVQHGRAGRYDEICERLSLDLKASATVLVVIQGRLGTGMSVCIDPKGGHAHMLMGGHELAALLRECADKLDGGQGPDGARETYTDEAAS